jgi:hypothetical protein
MQQILIKRVRIPRGQLDLQNFFIQQFVHQREQGHASFFATASMWLLGFIEPRNKDQSI